MSLRRQRLLPRYCRARGAQMGLSNVAVGPAGAAKPKSAKRKKAKKKAHSGTAAPRPPALLQCPACGCFLRPARRKGHAKRCQKKAKGRTAPALEVPQAVSLPAPRSAARPAEPSPQERAKKRLKQDNVLRSDALRARKAVVRAMSTMAVREGADIAGLLAALAAAPLDVEAHVLAYLRAAGLPAEGRLPPSGLKQLQGHIVGAFKSAPVEELPLARGFKLLSAEERAALSAQSAALGGG